MATEEQIEKLRKYVEEKGYPFYVISAATTNGTKELIDGVAEKLETLPPVLRYEAQPLTFEELEKINDAKRSFTVEKVDDHYFIVNAEWLAPILSTVNMDDYESLQYFQRVLRYSGIIDALENAGVEEEDTVAIFDFEFNYMR